MWYMNDNVMHKQVHATRVLQEEKWKKKKTNAPGPYQIFTRLKNFVGLIFFCEPEEEIFRIMTKNFDDFKTQNTDDRR